MPHTADGPNDSDTEAMAMFSMRDATAQLRALAIKGLKMTSMQRHE